MTTKVSELTTATSVAGEDLLMVVDNPANTSSIETKRITVNNFFSSLGVASGNNISANISGNLLSIATTSNGSFTKVKFNTFATPANSSYVNSTFTISTGDMFVDNTYIYVAISNTTIKRVALSAIS